MASLRVGGSNPNMLLVSRAVRDRYQGQTVRLAASFWSLGHDGVHLAMICRVIMRHVPSYFFSSTSLLPNMAFLIPQAKPPPLLICCPAS